MGADRIAELSRRRFIQLATAVVSGTLAAACDTQSSAGAQTLKKPETALQTIPGEATQDKSSPLAQAIRPPVVEASAAPNNILRVLPRVTSAELLEDRRGSSDIPRYEFASPMRKLGIELPRDIAEKTGIATIHVMSGPDAVGILATIATEAGFIREPWNNTVPGFRPYDGPKTSALGPLTAQKDLDPALTGPREIAFLQSELSRDAGITRGRNLPPEEWAFTVVPKPAIHITHAVVLPASMATFDYFRASTIDASITPIGVVFR